MMSLRRSRIGRFGASLAGLALGVQLLIASWGLALLAPADPADPFAEHALCLAGDDGKATPSPPTLPMPAHVHDGLCCLGHVPPGLQPSAAAAPQPVAYIEIAATPLADDAFIPGASHRPANARAPPTLA
jgi:hypothetical protein